MIRILHCVNDMHRAGLETMLMNYYRNIDRTKIQFDFLTHRPYRSDYDDEIESLGGKIYYAPRLYPQNYPAYFKWMRKFFKEHPEYKIVHSHIDTMSYLPLLAAKKAGVPIRIAHSHNTSLDKDFKYLLKQYFRFRINSVCTHRLACGKEAGEFLFGNRDFKVIPNAIDAEKFYFNKDLRDEKRKELGIKSEFVIGHVGRLSYQKNHKFLIRIFNELLKKEPESLLLLVGVGDKEGELRNQIKNLGIEDKVRFLGNRSDVNELYQAMDVFVMPSFFEGIPVVGVEAQFANLPCIFSDKVPKEVKFNKKTTFVSLNSSVEDWVGLIEKKKQTVRNSNKADLQNSQYEIRKAYSILENYYLALMEKYDYDNE
ncbi:MAG: glycosyltransferase family 1 protein [Streptococcus sp.]|uniref:glycosyltransferase family 1 protein n=1 Tax=Streptococcus sp. TaxID=1306 RepID=UPI0025910490|nr:glycosyltransferase family 1 protein [Streptococcus sp.]MCR5492936.1 glycosyltransferase family 1 protein [Streptococcus sp.]